MTVSQLTLYNAARRAIAPPNYSDRPQDPAAGPGRRTRQGEAPAEPHLLPSAARADRQCAIEMSCIPRTPVAARSAPVVTVRRTLGASPPPVAVRSTKFLTVRNLITP